MLQSLKKIKVFKKNVDILITVKWENNMSKIPQIGSGNITPSQLKTLEDVKKLDDTSIWTKFDTNKDEIITDKEILNLGFIKNAFFDVKGYLTEHFGKEKISNPRDNDGYFAYNEDSTQIPIRILKSLDELELRNGCCYDVRNCDITQLNLTKEQLLNLAIDKTTVMTEEQRAILQPFIEKTKDPGLGIRDLHKKGYTGKGVKMAIIDQPLGKHEEYSSNIIGKIHDINSEAIGNGWNTASLHGAAVASIAVGKTVGVAPEAGLVYYSAVNFSDNSDEIKEYKTKIKKEIKRAKKEGCDYSYYKNQLDMVKRFGMTPSNQPYADAINKILDENENLPENERVSVISISWGFNEYASGYDNLQKAVQRAKAQGVFVVSTALETQYGMNTCGANRDPQGDVNSPESYEAGAFFKSESENAPKEYKDSLLLFPMDHRTIADYTDNSSYRYEGNDGGMSWSTPWIAGMYVLAKQANPDITPEVFWKYALETSNECRNNDSGVYIGRIINPQKLIEIIETNK